MCTARVVVLYRLLDSIQLYVAIYNCCCLHHFACEDARYILSGAGAVEGGEGARVDIEYDSSPIYTYDGPELKTGKETIIATSVLQPGFELCLSI